MAALKTGYEVFFKSGNSSGQCSIRFIYRKQESKEAEYKKKETNVVNISDYSNDSNDSDNDNDNPSNINYIKKIPNSSNIKKIPNPSNIKKIPNSLNIKKNVRHNVQDSKKMKHGYDKNLEEMTASQFLRMIKKSPPTDTLRNMYLMLHMKIDSSFIDQYIEHYEYWDKGWASKYMRSLKWRLQQKANKEIKEKK